MSRAAWGVQRRRAKATRPQAPAAGAASVRGRACVVRGRLPLPRRPVAADLLTNDAHMLERPCGSYVRHTLIAKLESLRVTALRLRGWRRELPVRVDDGCSPINGDRQQSVCSRPSAIGSPTTRPDSGPSKRSRFDHCGKVSPEVAAGALMAGARMSSKGCPFSHRARDRRVLDSRAARRIHVITAKDVAGHMTRQGAGISSTPGHPGRHERSMRPSTMPMRRSAADAK